MDHQDWPGWPEDDPQFEHGFGDSFDHADADTADLGGHDGGFDHDPLGHDPLSHDPLSHDPLGHDGLGDDPLGHGLDGSDAMHEPGPDLTHEATYEDETPAAGHGHLGAAGDVYPEDDPFAAGHHDETAVHDGAVVHDDVPTDHDSSHDSSHDSPLADDHQLVDHPVGADPDIDPRADGDWHDPEFPPTLDLHDAPEPIDGYPWTDPHVLGAGLTDDAIDGAIDGAIDDDGYHEAAWQHPPIGDLYDYAGDEQAPGIDGWHALFSSDDPATSTLARWWTPGS